MRIPEENDRPLSYREMAPRLAEYVQRLGFSHVEFLPIMEHPFYASWGYQTTGYFAPTSRYGTPQDFMYLVDYLHQHGIGVILDWVPSHFPSDGHGLAYFDGTHLFEHADWRRDFIPTGTPTSSTTGATKSAAFCFRAPCSGWTNIMPTACAWMRSLPCCISTIRVAKASGFPINTAGGKISRRFDFLRKFNTDAYKEQPGIQTVAEESTAWPMVSRPTYVGGLGFGMKWDMGWMHDTLEYFKQDPIHRKYHHNQLTFRMLYGFTENFVLPLSHDEVVHGKGSLVGKMPGDEWQRFANLRLLYGYMFGQP
jgi:1,4-alpha-glucan branching enzyme